MTHKKTACQKPLKYQVEPSNLNYTSVWGKPKNNQITTKITDNRVIESLKVVEGIKNE